MEEDKPRDGAPIDWEDKEAKHAREAKVAKEAKEKEAFERAGRSSRAGEERKDDDSHAHERHEANHSASGSDAPESDAPEGNPGGGNPGGGFMPDNQTLLLVAGGALAAFAALNFGSIAGKLRPLAVAAVKEGYGFAEWLAAKVEGAKEDIEDIVAEGVHEHYAERTAASETAEREKELWGAMEQIVERRVRGKRSDK